MTNNDNLTFLTNNVKEIHSSKTIIKLIEYFKSKLNYNGFLFFLRETHLTIKNENTWVNDFNGPVLFSHGAFNSCGALIAYLGKTSSVLHKQKVIELGES